MGGRDRGLRARWRLLRRQLRGGGRRLRGDPGRPPYIGLSPYADRDAARTSGAAGASGRERGMTIGHHYRARSAAREEDGFDCRTIFIFGFATCSRSRTPLPPDGLGTPGLISSIPAFSSAETSFMSESTLARMTPSLASMR